MGYKLELLSPETMKLLRNTKKDVDQDKDGEDVPKLESVEVVLVHCNERSNIKGIIYFCAKQTIWTVNKYFTTFTNNARHKK